MISSIQNLQIQSLRFPLNRTAKTILLLLLLLPVTAISDAHFKIKTLVSDGARKMLRIQKKKNYRTRTIIKHNALSNYYRGLYFEEQFVS